jgi:hypothetical protein
MAKTQSKQTVLATVLNRVAKAVALVDDEAEWVRPYDVRVLDEKGGVILEIRIPDDSRMNQAEELRLVDARGKEFRD